ncbi:MAG TPA: GHMP kinase, partial [Candidatus Hydrogenedentes bacterium]|nr:GHMP kinase [Candidatus Hydrogenedentota bacterium]
GSETIHQTVRERWLEGDREVVAAMKDFAGYAQAARDLIVAGRGREIGPLLDKNFERRCSIFKMDPLNVAMVNQARSVGAHAKLAGSGGAIVGIYEDDRMYTRLVKAMETVGAVVIKPQMEAD